MTWHQRVEAGLCGQCGNPWPGRAGGSVSDLCDWCDTELILKEQALLRRMGIRPERAPRMPDLVKPLPDLGDCEREGEGMTGEARPGSLLRRESEDTATLRTGRLR